MKVLLDTHVFIWMLNETEKLSHKATQILRDPDNELILSVASIWEIQIKETLGKIKFQESIETIFEKLAAQTDLKILPIEANHIFELSKFPLHHKDPFDRILIAQSNYEGAHLMSSDKVFLSYPVKIMW